MEELKPCPFCGEQPLTLNGNAFCLSSDCCGGMLQFPIAAWNRRPLPAEQTGGWRVDFRPLLVSGMLCSNGRILIDSEQSREQQTVALFHEVLHRLGIEDEGVVEQYAAHLAAVAPHILDLLPAPPVVDDKTEKEKQP